MGFFFHRLRGGIFYSVAQWFGTYDDHEVNDSTPSLVLFRPWIKCFNFFEKISFQVLLIFFLAKFILVLTRLMVQHPA